MNQPRRYSRPRQESDVSGSSDRRRDERKEAVSQMMAENREGLGMKVIAIMVQRYGVLPKEMWDLNSISDMGAERGLTYSEALTKAKFKRITSNSRYTIVNLAISSDVSKKVDLPHTLRRLIIKTEEYDYPIDLPDLLQELKFDPDCKYNRPLMLPDKLRKLKLNGFYDQPLTFPSTLIELELGRVYSQPLNLPLCLERLSFSLRSQFNLPLALPQSLTSVLFGESYNQPVVLSSGIQELRVGLAFTNNLSLPSSLRKVEWRCNRPVQLPAGVIEVKFSDRFNQPLLLPANLKKASFAVARYPHPLILPTDLEELIWGPVVYHEELVLPESLRKLTWGSHRPIGLPAGLRELIIRKSAPLILPEGLLKVAFVDCWSHYDLPESVQEVSCLSGSFSQNRFTHPTTLQHLILNLSYSTVDLSSHKVHKLTVGGKHFRILKWPEGLKELEFTDDTLDYALRKPKGCKIVGVKRPRNAF